MISLQAEDGHLHFGQLQGSQGPENIHAPQKEVLLGLAIQ